MPRHFCSSSENAHSSEMSVRFWPLPTACCHGQLAIASAEPWPACPYYVLEHYKNIRNHDCHERHGFTSEVIEMHDISEICLMNATTVTDYKLTNGGESRLLLRGMQFVIWRVNKSSGSKADEHCEHDESVSQPLFSSSFGQRLIPSADKD